jgi:hypothetical protein
VRQHGELAGGERIRDRHEGEQPVLEPLALLGAGSTGEDLQAAVHLQGIRRDRDGVLPTLAQPLGDLDRNRGLPDPGGAEDRYEGVRASHDR